MMIPKYSFFFTRVEENVRYCLLGLDIGIYDVNVLYGKFTYVSDVN